MYIDDKTVEELKIYAAEETLGDMYEEDGTLVVDVVGDNVDDAYESGRNDGCTELSRRLLEKLKV